MKRLLLITCCFLVVFAGAAAAWESCKQISIASDDHHRSVPAHGHDHHSDSDHHTPTIVRSIVRLLGTIL